VRPDPGNLKEGKSNSYGAKDYLDLCKEIIKRSK